MRQNFIILESRTNSAQRTRPTSREDYFIKHQPVEMHGRLGYGGQKAKLVGCEILELSERGAYVEPYAPIDGTPKFFTLEINGQYQRARLRETEGRKLRLEFFNENLHYIDVE
jgi:hypothetical protein